MRRPIRWRRGVILALVALAVPLSTPELARADDPVDVVLLKSGERLRGAILDEDAVRGIWIRLEDGSNRQVKPADIKKVQHAPDPHAKGGATRAESDTVVTGTDADEGEPEVPRPSRRSRTPHRRAVEGDGGGCTPGEQIACACPTGGQGFQVCTEAGDRFRPCFCSSSSETDERNQRTSASRSRSGVGMVVGGITLMSTSLVVTAAAVAIHVVSEGSHDSQPIVAIVAANAVGLMVAGIPLTVVGAGRIHPDADPPKPEAYLTVAPTGLGFMATF